MDVTIVLETCICHNGNEVQVVMIKLEEVNELSNLPKLRIIMEKHKLKPNFSDLSRKFHVVRRIVKKYYNGYNKSKIRVRKSKIDSLHSLIQELLNDDAWQIVKRKQIYGVF